MGRELRMVVPNWEHPKNQDDENYQPMFDESYKEACAEWKKDFAAWEAGERPDYWTKGEDPDEYWDWESTPPTNEGYRPEWDKKDMTWFQIYETVSEGTPVTPPFETKEELIDYLVENGDFWCQSRGSVAPTRNQAEGLVNGGWAPSGMMMNGVMHDAYQSMDVKDTKL